MLYREPCSLSHPKSSFMLMNAWVILWIKLFFIHCILTGLKFLLYWQSFSLILMISMLVWHATSQKGIVFCIYHVRKMIHLFKEFINIFKLIYIYYILIENLLLQTIHLIIILTIIHFINLPPVYLMIVVSHRLIFMVYITIQILVNQWGTSTFANGYVRPSLS